jgi:hypothetical protein
MSYQDNKLKYVSTDTLCLAIARILPIRTVFRLAVLFSLAFNGGAQTISETLYGRISTGTDVAGIFVGTNADLSGYPITISLSFSNIANGFLSRSTNYEEYCSSASTMPNLPPPPVISGSITINSHTLSLSGSGSLNCVQGFSDSNRIVETFSSVPVLSTVVVNEYGGPYALGQGNLTSPAKLDQYLSSLNSILIVIPFVGPEFISVSPCTIKVSHSAREASPSSPTGTAMFAEAFSPSSVKLIDAANGCGFVGFEWQQKILNLPCVPSLIYPFVPSSRIFPRVPSLISPQNMCPLDPLQSLTASPDNPINDPPSGGVTALPAGYDPFPYVYAWTTATSGGKVALLDQETMPNVACDATNTVTPLTAGCVPIVSSDGKVLAFHDDPSGPWSDTDAQQNPPPYFLAFTTSLVGVDKFGNPVSPPLYQWSWTSTFNGTFGGVHQLSSFNPSPPDPGSGIGGISITNINGVQLPTAVPSSQINTTASGLAYSRITQTFNGTVTVKNIGRSAISGPLQIVLFGMPVGITLANATGNLSGTPYLTVPNVTTFAPGQAATVSVQFKNPSSAAVNFTPAIYSGSIN